MGATDKILEDKKHGEPSGKRKTLYRKKNVRPTRCRFNCLMLLLLTLIYDPGCSPVSMEKPPEAVEKRTCDVQADTAMRLEAYETSIRYHLLFLEKEPENELALYHLGFSYGQTGNHEKEVFYYEKAIAHGFKEDQIFFNLGMAFGEISQFEKAIHAFKEGLALNPASADNYFGLGVIYQNVGRVKDAERAFKKTIEIDRENLDARFHLSQLYADMGLFLDARHQLLEILEIDPSNIPAQDMLDNLKMDEGRD